MLLAVRKLRVHYDKAEALKGISIDVETGAIVSLIGANGAGKTTTLRTICGLKSQTSGEVWLQGVRIDGLPPYEITRLGVGHVPEGRMVFGSLSVLENLMMGAYLVKDRKKIASTLERVFSHFEVLKGKLAQNAASLSGGEQQMLAVARALMSGPTLLLMDEPSLGLSPILVSEVGNMICQINEVGVTIVLVEQNARMALRLANTAYVLEIGKIAMEGDAKEMASNEHIVKTYLGG